MNTIKPFLLVFLILCTPLFGAEIPSIDDFSLDEKIGQLIMMATVSAPDLNEGFMQSQPYSLDHEYVQRMIEEHHIGGVIFLGAGTPEQQTAVTEQLQTLSKHPLLIGLDAEWGLSMRHQKDVISFPRAMVLGALAPEHDHLIYELGKEIARQCKELGVHINFAPVADVNNNPRNPIINTRSFGQNPEKVALKAALFMRGMQNAGILACAKHFPGHGDTEVDSHHKRGIIPHPQERLEAIELAPFKHVIDEGVAAIMTAHLDVPALSPDENVPATLSRTILTDLLRKRLGFKGLTVTDGLGMKGVTDDFAPGELEVKALLAGNDLLVCPVDVPRAVASIKQAMKDGRISEQDINERVARILQVKKQTIHISDKKEMRLITPHARDLKKRLYQAAVTIARDDAKKVPAKPVKQDTPLKVITFGNADQFLKTITHHYNNIQHSGYALDTSEANMSDDDSDHRIVSIHLEGRSGMIEQQSQETSCGMPGYVSYINKHADHVTLALFGNPYNIAQFKNVPTIIVGYENEPEAQQAVAEVILGERTATGILPVTPN